MDDDDEFTKKGCLRQITGHSAFTNSNNTFKPFHVGILYTDALPNSENRDEMRHDACI